MPDTDSITTECGQRIVNGIDFLARRFDLHSTPVPLTTTLGALGLGDNDCGIVERYTNTRRTADGKKRLKSGTIKSTTTIQQVIDYAC